MEGRNVKVLLEDLGQVAFEKQYPVLKVMTSHDNRTYLIDTICTELNPFQFNFQYKQKLIRMSDYFYEKYSISLDLTQPLLLAKLPSSQSVYLPSELCHPIETCKLTKKHKINQNDMFDKITSLT